MIENFKDCLQKRKIREFSRGKNLLAKELKIAFEDFKVAKQSLEQKNFRWSIVQSYYSMFHAARALLYAKNYREKSHYCLIEAIKALYVENGLLPIIYVEFLMKAKNLREAADYYGDFSPDNTKDILDHAKSFIEITKKILK